MTGSALPLLALDPDLDLWDRHPGETVYRHAQFRTYLDVGRSRTLRKTSETLTRSHDHVRKVSAAYRWVERAEAYDRHLDALHGLIWLEERRKAAIDDARILSDAVEKLADSITALVPADLTPADIIRLLDVVMRQRRALFPPEQTTILTGPGGDPVQVQLAELAALTADQRRAAVLGLADDVRRRALAAGGEDDAHPRQLRAVWP